METTTLGRSGLEVSRIAYGSGPLAGAMGHLDADQAIRAVRAARDVGINLFDTARTYGAAEELVGRALREHLRADRDAIVLTSKTGVRVLDGPDGGVVRDSTAAAVRADIETSLRTLGVDHIDIYQVHWPDPEVPFAETACVLRELLAEGKIRHIGVSNFSAAQLAEFDACAVIETLQPVYHLFHRDEESDGLRWAHEHDVGVLVYGALAHGLLRSGAPLDPARDFGAVDWRRGHGLFQAEALEANLRTAAELRAFAGDHGCSLSQLAVAWVLAQRGVHVAIVGTRSAEHIVEAAASVDVRLSGADLEEIDRIMRGAVAVPAFALEDV